MSEHSNNLIISKLALLQVFYAFYWPVNAKKNCFVCFIFFNCVTRIIPFFTANLNRKFINQFWNIFLRERTRIEAFQIILTRTEPKFETAVAPKSNLNRKNQTVGLPSFKSVFYQHPLSIFDGTRDVEAGGGHILMEAEARKVCRFHICMSWILFHFCFFEIHFRLLFTNYL